MSNIDSRQVSWWPVHEFVEARVAQAGPLPWPGTPAWCAMPDSDPRKLLALARFGEHHALRIETAQQEQADASRQISASQDWAAIARKAQGRNNFRAANEWATRKGSAA